MVSCQPDILDDLPEEYKPLATPTARRCMGKQFFTGKTRALETVTFEKMGETVAYFPASNNACLR